MNSRLLLIAFLINGLDFGSCLPSLRESEDKIFSTSEILDWRQIGDIVLSVSKQVDKLKEENPLDYLFVKPLEEDLELIEKTIFTYDCQKNDLERIPILIEKFGTSLPNINVAIEHARSILSDNCGELFEKARFGLKFSDFSNDYYDNFIEYIAAKDRDLVRLVTDMKHLKQVVDDATYQFMPHYIDNAELDKPEKSKSILLGYIQEKVNLICHLDPRSETFEIDLMRAYLNIEPSYDFLIKNKDNESILRYILCDQLRKTDIEYLYKSHLVNKFSRQGLLNMLVEGDINEMTPKEVDYILEIVSSQENYHKEKQTRKSEMAKRIAKPLKVPSEPICSPEEMEQVRVNKKYAKNEILNGYLTKHVSEYMDKCAKIFYQDHGSVLWLPDDLKMILDDMINRDNVDWLSRNMFTTESLAQSLGYYVDSTGLKVNGLLKSKKSSLEAIHEKISSLAKTCNSYIDLYNSTKYELKRRMNVVDAEMRRQLLGNLRSELKIRLLGLDVCLDVSRTPPSTEDIYRAAIKLNK